MAKRHPSSGAPTVQAEVRPVHPRAQSRAVACFWLGLLSWLPYLYGVNFRLFMLLQGVPAALAPILEAGLWVLLFTGLPAGILALIFARQAKDGGHPFYRLFGTVTGIVGTVTSALYVLLGLGSLL